MLGFSGFGLAALPIGLIADAVGLRETLVTMGALVALVSVLFILMGRRRQRQPAATL
jgi:fucose permease